MTRYFRTLAAAILVFSGPVHANAVAEWNFIATQVAMSEEQPSVQPGHAVAMVHVAMFEVLNFIDPRYASPYLVHPPGPVRSSCSMRRCATRSPGFQPAPTTTAARSRAGRLP